MKRLILPISLIAVLALAGILSLLFILIRPAPSAHLRAEIYVDGELVRTVDLTEQKEVDRIRIETPYGYNVLEVGPGYVRMDEADCPHKTCTHMGRRTSDGIPIVCLPHRLVVRVRSADVTADGVTY